MGSVKIALSRWQTGLLPVHRAAVAAEALFDLKPNEESRPPMSPAAIASIVFGCSFGAALIGMVLHVKLPDHHLDGDSRDVVKLVMGLIATNDLIGDDAPLLPSGVRTRHAAVA